MDKKQEIWAAEADLVNRLADKLNKGIDLGIKETVIALRVLGFPTSASCEGHLTRGKPYPWVRIRAEEPQIKNWRENRRVRAKYTRENLRYRVKMIRLLEKFYEKRRDPFNGRIPFDARLVLSQFGIFGAFRLQSFGAELIPLWTREEKKRKLALYRKEMRVFARFLKEEFFKKK